MILHSKRAVSPFVSPVTLFYLISSLHHWRGQHRSFFSSSNLERVIVTTCNGNLVRVTFFFSCFSSRPQSFLFYGDIFQLGIPVGAVHLFLFLSSWWSMLSAFLCTSRAFFALASWSAALFVFWFRSGANASNNFILLPPLKHETKPKRVC